MRLGNHESQRLVRDVVRKPRRSAAAVPVKPMVNIGTSKSCGTVITITLPRGHARAGHAATHMEKLRTRVERLVGGLYAVSRPTAKLEQLVGCLEAAAAEKSVTVFEAVRTKTPFATFGVNSVVSLHVELKAQAAEREQSFAMVARELFELGFKTLDQRLWDEPSKVVLGSFKDAYAVYGQGKSDQWSLRVPRKLHLKALLLAQEHGISQSQLACWCIATALETYAIA